MIVLRSKQILRGRRSQRGWIFILAQTGLGIALILGFFASSGTALAPSGAARAGSLQSQEQLFPLFFIPWPPSPSATRIEDYSWISVMVSLEAFQEALDGLETRDPSGAAKPLQPGQKILPQTQLSWRGGKPLLLRVPDKADITLSPSSKTEWLLANGYPGVRAVQGAIDVLDKKSGKSRTVKGPSKEAVRIGAVEAAAPEELLTLASTSEEKAQPAPVRGAQNPGYVKYVEPEYPSIAQTARIEGIVIMDVTVDEKGYVTDVQVIKGNPLLNEAAVKAMRQCQFKPLLIKGKPSPALYTVTATFSMK